MNIDWNKAVTPDFMRRVAADMIEFGLERDDAEMVRSGITILESVPARSS